VNNIIDHVLLDVTRMRWTEHVACVIVIRDVGNILGPKSEK